MIISQFSSRYRFHCVLSNHNVLSKRGSFYLFPSRIGSKCLSSTQTNNNADGGSPFPECDPQQTPTQIAKRLTEIYRDVFKDSPLLSLYRRGAAKNEERAIEIDFARMTAQLLHVYNTSESFEECRNQIEMFDGESDRYREIIEFAMKANNTKEGQSPNAESLRMQARMFASLAGQFKAMNDFQHFRHLHFPPGGPTPTSTSIVASSSASFVSTSSIDELAEFEESNRFDYTEVFPGLLQDDSHHHHHHDHPETEPTMPPLVIDLGHNPKEYLMNMLLEYRNRHHDANNNNNSSSNSKSAPILIAVDRDVFSCAYLAQFKHTLIEFLNNSDNSNSATTVLPQDIIQVHQGNVFDLDIVGLVVSSGAAPTTVPPSPQRHRHHRHHRHHHQQQLLQLLGLRRRIILHMENLGSYMRFEDIPPDDDDDDVLAYRSSCSISISNNNNSNNNTDVDAIEDYNQWYQTWLRIWTKVAKRWTQQLMSLSSSSSPPSPSSESQNPSPPRIDVVIEHNANHEALRRNAPIIDAFKAVIIAAPNGNNGSNDYNCKYRTGCFDPQGLFHDVALPTTTTTTTTRNAHSSSSSADEEEVEDDYALEAELDRVCTDNHGVVAHVFEIRSLLPTTS